MNKRLNQTLKKHKNNIKHGTFIDSYNQIISDLSGTITTRVSDSNNTFVAVKPETGIKIVNATKKGYLIAYDGDGVDLSTRIKNHRGTVQRGCSQTIKTQIDIGVVLLDERQS